jgi:hypothetical protein
MQARSDRTEKFGDAAFDCHVDVFIMWRANESVRCKLVRNVFQSLNESVGFLGRDQTRGGESGDVPDGANDVVPPQHGIEAETLRQVPQRGIHCGGETSTPQGHERAVPFFAP